jgi:hypothetical protein
MRRACLFLLVLSMALLAGCTANDIVPKSVVGSGNTVTQQYDLSGFAKVETGHGFRLQIGRSEPFAVTVDVDDNLVQYLDVRVSGDTLHIGFTPAALSLSNAHLSARVSMPELAGLTLSGGCQTQVAGFQSGTPFAAELSGGSGLEGDLTCGDASFDMSGGSQATLTGTAANLTVSGSGGSQAFLSGLAAKDVHVDLSGGSRAEVSLSGKLSGDASGGAVIQYSGTPTSVNVSKSGGAQVLQK